MLKSLLYWSYGNLIKMKCKSCSKSMYLEKTLRMSSEINQSINAKAHTKSFEIYKLWYAK